MVFTLHRYIFRELFRVFVLATAALTLMLSVGLLVPTIQEFGVSPGQIIHLLGYFLPITLTFVLPMSALFSASLVYGRFAADRELDACRASGISMGTLIYPGLMLAIFVAIANLILSFHVAPAFVHRSARETQANAEHILFRNIQKKGSYTIPQNPNRLYADRSIPEKNLLEGVVIVNLAKRELVTAEEANVWIETRDTYNKATIVAENAYRFTDTAWTYLGHYKDIQEFPSLLADEIQFQNIEQLKQIQADKMNFFPIREQVLQARAQLAIEMLARDFNIYMQQTESPFQLEDESRIYYLRAPGCGVNSDRANTLILRGPIQLVQVDKHGSGVTVKYTSEKGSIALESEAENLRLEINLENPSWERPGVRPGKAVGKFANNIRFPKQFSPVPSIDKTMEVIQDETEMSALAINPSGRLKGLLEKIPEELAEVDNEIYAEIHSRLVLGLGCIALILTGIALGIQSRGGHMLSAFGASAIPGGLLVVFILSGKEMTKNPSTEAIVGVSVMWIGLAVLLILTLWIYRKLLRT